MRILVLGRNPSKRNIDPQIPFQGAPCYKRLQKWLDYLSEPGRAFILDNCSSDPDAKFTPYTIDFYVASLLFRCQDMDAVLALGNDVEKVCLAAGIKYFKLPHPSGLNRSVNNRIKILETLVECNKWLSER